MENHFIISRLTPGFSSPDKVIAIRRSCGDAQTGGVGAMAIEGLDAGLAIESTSFVPQVGLPETEAGPTLDAALAAAAQRAVVPQPGADEGDARELAAPDLWVSARPGYRPEIQLAQLDPVAGAFTGSPVVDAGAEGEADAPAPDPLLLHKLTIDDLRASGTGRYGDSTEDYAWWELSTSDYEWAKQCFMMDIKSGGAAYAYEHGATTQAEYDSLVSQYIASLGLSSVVHVNAPVGQEIVVTGNRFNLINSFLNSPHLTLDPNQFAFLDLNAVGPDLDRNNIEIIFDPNIPMTAENLQALTQLRHMITNVQNYLAQLPAWGVFQTTKGPITVAELRELFAMTDFYITPENTNYEGNGIPGYPGAGQAIRNDGNPIFETSINNLREAMITDMRALNYILHELAHVTFVGDTNFHQTWANGTPSPTDFIANEIFANDLSRIIAATMGHPYYDQFLVTYGFSPDSGMIFIPSGDLQGGGGGGGGGTGGGGGGGGQVGEN
jgi:hypothetical protein